MPIVVFPDKTLEIGIRQSQLLVERGLIRPDRHGFRGDDSQAALLAMIESPEFMVCDFCGASPVRWEFPCEDFLAVETPRETHNSLGGWMACDPCAELIHEAKINQLSERALDAYFAKHPDDAADLPRHTAIEIGLRGLHRAFHNHRVGPGRRI